MDRGARLLRLLAARTIVAENEPLGSIWLDELSAGLLARCFKLTSRHEIWLLSGPKLNVGTALFWYQFQSLGPRDEKRRYRGGGGSVIFVA